MPTTVEASPSDCNDPVPSVAFVYVLGCKSGNTYCTYVGWTIDLDQRLARHNAGTGAKTTRGRTWSLLYAERLPSRTDAMRREWYLKRDRQLRRRLARTAQGIAT